MITLAEARKIAEDFIGPEDAIVEDSILEKPFGWYFDFNNREYVETGNPLHRTAGCGGLVVNKETGKVFTFSSAVQLEDNFAAYEAGYTDEPYELTVTQVHNLEEALEYLLKLRVHYWKDVEFQGRIVKGPASYTQEELQTLLKDLPCSFDGLNLFYEWETMQALDASGCMEYRLVGNEGEQKQI